MNQQLQSDPTLMEPHANLSQKQQQVFTLASNGGVTYSDLEDALGIKRSTVRDHVSALVQSDVPVEKRTEDGDVVVYHADDVPDVDPEPDAPTRQKPASITSKASHTKEKRKTLNEIQAWLVDELAGRAVVPDDPPEVNESNEDMVVHRSDDHAGAWYVNDGEENAYDDEILAERVRAVNDRTFELKARQEQSGINFDTMHMLFGGDGVHGEGIHGDQPWESCLNLVEQIELWVDLYSEFIDRATKEFNHVQLVCQRGNHGELRGDGMSPDANADDICYLMLENRILDRGYSNVSIKWRRGGGYYTNFRMRAKPEEDTRRAEALGLDSVGDLPPEYQSGHRAHLRHGQNSLYHVGTSSGKNKWRHWLHDQHKADIGYRGHFHEFRIENLDSKPVIMSGSICPPDDFEEGLAVWSEPAATIHGVSDERPLTWMYPVDFKD